MDSPETPQPAQLSKKQKLGLIAGITTFVGTLFGILSEPLAAPIHKNLTPTPTKSPGLVTPGPTKTLSPENQAIADRLQGLTKQQNDIVATAMEKKRGDLLHSGENETQTPTPAAPATPTGPLGGK